MTLAFARTGEADEDLAPRLEIARQKQDPLADDALAEILESKATGRLFDRLVACRKQPACKALWEQVHSVPSWADKSVCQAGNTMAFSNVVTSGLALMCGSLAESFVAANGAKVLTRTGRLLSDGQRRVYETADFTTAIAECNGPWPGTHAHRDVVSVRLIHAMARRNVVDGWDDSWGRPVNQEDMLGTLMMFSHVYRRSLEALGVDLSPDEHLGVNQTWRFTGFMLGVDEDLLPTSVDHEAQLYAAVSKRQFTPDADSRALTHALFDAMANVPPFFLPAVALHEAGRLCLGDEIADELDLKRHPRWERTIAALVRANRTRAAVARHVPEGARTRVGRLMASSILATSLDERGKF